MPLINFTNEELYKIDSCMEMESIEKNKDGDSHGESLCKSIIDKIQNSYLEESN